MEHTWDILEFNNEIPQIMDDNDFKESVKRRRRYNMSEYTGYIYPAVIENSLVYRCFIIAEDSFAEKYRYIFIDDKILRESSDHDTKEITLDEVRNTKFIDVIDKEKYIVGERIFDIFKEKVHIRNKNAMLRVFPYVKHSTPKLHSGAFLEIYSKTREITSNLERVPKRIADELYGRKHAAFSCLRIDKDLVVITGERKGKHTLLKEQTRIYFDKKRSYYFVHNAATGFWEKEEICKQFQYERETKDRLIDGDLLCGTFAERYIPYAIGKEIVKGNRVIYGSILAQIGFLCAEQAAKTNKRLYKTILEGIYDGTITEGRLSLPEIIGISGPQLKYLEGIDIPYNLDTFAKCIKDREFREHFPDVKKRIFAASVYSSHHYDFEGYAGRLDKEDLFSAAKTICSIEKADESKRYRLASELLDYLKMRKRYLSYIDGMRDDDPFYKEVKGFGEVPINIKPSKIHDAHNKLGDLISIITRKRTIEECDKDIAMRKQCEADEVEYTDGSFSVLMPSDAKEIIREGRILHHCVGHGGYIEAMARRECRILFLRDNSKIREPLITMEERSGAIVQCYGFADSINKDEKIRDFINEYAKQRKLKIRAMTYLA